MCTPKYVFALHHVRMHAGSYTHVQLGVPLMLSSCVPPLNNISFKITLGSPHSLSLFQFPTPPPLQPHYYQATSCNQDMCIHTFSCMNQTRGRAEI